MGAVDDAERTELRAVTRGFFEKYSDESAVRATIASEESYDRTMWDAMATQLGLAGMVIPEEYGGGEFAYADLEVVLEEMGRALVCAPFLSTAVLVPAALLASGDRDACARVLPAIADGSLIATLAFTDDFGQWSADDAAVTADRRSEGYVLNGRRRFVLDGVAAGALLVVARTDTGHGLFLVEADAAGVSRRKLETLDLTREHADLCFADVEATLIGADGAASDYVEAALDAALVGVAAQQVGAARRALELSVEYAQIREQFERVIGSFQVIKHKCADMLLDVETATSAAVAAAVALDELTDDRSVVASLAKAYCSEAFKHVAAETIQVHGGIGFTWEHPAHLYFRRARGDEVLFGTPAAHRERMLVRLGH
ncbi:acyl-CoA dehydrogenase family protein [[Mycobacterium] wendilense]|uniref:Acyl-CoA dehydrogenase family protein n=1 Tax=[Mycobacterium] wendilense TaxID=3064284 RepID=A0ABN9PAC7_9MYCO|nr:acyl-CoA dehydrogenase family protein [Mycolicibacterium sp. MU0050]CAJ1586028.1 acyl-CoA dehydrogenase family protein [Mycolicibacterium sp. MU0050]